MIIQQKLSKSEAYETKRRNGSTLPGNDVMDHVIRLRGKMEQCIEVAESMVSLFCWCYNPNLSRKSVRPDIIPRPSCAVGHHSSRCLAAFTKCTDIL